MLFSPPPSASSALFLSSHAMPHKEHGDFNAGFHSLLLLLVSRREEGGRGDARGVEGGWERSGEGGSEVGIAEPEFLNF